MTRDDQYETSKKAIFDSMSKKAQERILRVGYENWDPFPEPKDPRDRIFGSAALRSHALVDRFFKEQLREMESVAIRKELFELCRGLLSDDARAKAVYDFCQWFEKQDKID